MLSALFLTTVRRALFVSVVAVNLGTPALIAQQNPPSIWSGVYTEIQASEGEKLYVDTCATCHGDDLGGIERAPALAGGTFRETWRGSTLRKLFERIEDMPPDEPKVLGPEQIARVMAFLLRTSEFPAGSSTLPASKTALGAILFNPTRPTPP